MIKEYFDQKLPENVVILSVTLVLTTNASDLDLNDIYNRTIVTKDGIQVVEYEKETKHIDVSLLTHRRTKRVEKNRGFSNCISFKFEERTIRLFANGKLMLIGKYDKIQINSNINHILTLVGDIEITNIKVGMIQYSLSCCNVNILSQRLAVHEEVTNAIPNSMYKYKENAFYVNSHLCGKIVISSRSFDDIIEVVNFITDLQTTYFCWYKPWTWY